MKTCDHCHMPRDRGHVMRLPGGRAFTVCAFCHQRLASLFPDYPSLVAAILEAHADLRKPVSP